MNGFAYIGSIDNGKKLKRTIHLKIIVHRSVDGLIIVINVCSVRRKDGKKWTKQYNNEES